MLKKKEIIKLVKARLEDAKVLISSQRFDGAVYLCGYAVELGLKGRICKTLKWEGYPSTGGEFQNFKSFRTHDLETLLHLSGVEKKIKTRYLGDWSAVLDWKPEFRYQPIGEASKESAEAMYESTNILLTVL